MLNTRGIIVLASFIFVIVLVCKAWSDGKTANYLCDVRKIDNCARNGGLKQ